MSITKVNNWEFLIGNRKVDLRFMLYSSPSSSFTFKKEKYITKKRYFVPRTRGIVVRRRNITRQWREAYMNFVFRMFTIYQKQHHVLIEPGTVDLVSYD